MNKIILTFLLLLPTVVMAQTHHTVSEKFLQSFADAFNAHDVDAIMTHMSDDCVFQASAGPDVDGQKFVGQEQVKKAFEDVFATYPMRNGTIRSILSRATEALPNGSSPEPGKTALRLKSRVAISLPLKTVK